MPDVLFPFQAHLVEWALRRGRAAIFADTGLGKTLMQLVWADNVVRKTNGRVLILTPLAVGPQTVAEGERFGIESKRIRDGSLGGPGIYVTNYEQLHRFEPSDFAGLVCDESSIIKHFTGATQKGVTRFASKLPYRLLCTATAAPNDYTELGTSSEALGEIGYVDMLGRFFVHDPKVAFHALHRLKNDKGKRGNVASALGGRMYRMKGHAEEAFWRWVASWARACRKPSDLGFEDEGFVLPLLTENQHVVEARTLAPGQLFARPAIGFQEEREERKRTMPERVEAVARLVEHKALAAVWCHLNAEGDALEKAIPGAVQVAGKDSDEAKEERLLAFARGEIRVLVTKAKIAGFGLNLQKCAHVATFVSHSYEQHYQTVRRCWRYGQTRPVTVDIVSTEGESAVAANMQRKAEAAARMFDALVRHMRDATVIKRDIYEPLRVEVPGWLSVK
jgi:hypothetical protein